MTDERLEDLEARLTFQEHTVEQLNEALSRQQLMVSELQNTVEVLRAHLRQLSDRQGGPDSVTDEKPPHY